MAKYIKAPNDLNRMNLFCRCGGECFDMDSAGTSLCDSCKSFKLANLPSVFLAGSIEMGKAEDWQAKMELALANEDVLVLNPRRDDWDSSWKQSIRNAQFRKQVEWELRAQEIANVIAMNFVAGMKAPITLLEFGLFARSGKLIVHCPEGFWRKGNVDIVCRKYKIEQASDIGELTWRTKIILRGIRK